MSDPLDLELRRALREEAYRPPVRLTGATLAARLEATESGPRLGRLWRARFIPVAALVVVLSLVAFGLMSRLPDGFGQTPASRDACDESPATRHGWWTEMGGPNAFFNIEPGTRLSTAGGSWLLFTRFDPDAAPTDQVSISAERLGATRPIAGRLNRRVDPRTIFRFDEPAPSLPGGWYLFELDIPSGGCWVFTGSIGGRVVGTATVDVGASSSETAFPSTDIAPTPATATDGATASTPTALLPNPGGTCTASQLVASPATITPEPATLGTVHGLVTQPVENAGDDCVLAVPKVIGLAAASGPPTAIAVPNLGIAVCAGGSCHYEYPTSYQIQSGQAFEILLNASWWRPSSYDFSHPPCGQLLAGVSRGSFPVSEGTVDMAWSPGVLGEVCVAAPSVSVGINLN